MLARVGISGGNRPKSNRPGFGVVPPLQQFCSGSNLNSELFLTVGTVAVTIGTPCYVDRLKQAEYLLSPTSTSIRSASSLFQILSHVAQPAIGTPWHESAGQLDGMSPIPFDCSLA